MLEESNLLGGNLRSKSLTSNSLLELIADSKNLNHHYHMAANGRAPAAGEYTAAGNGGGSRGNG